MQSIYCRIDRHEERQYCAGTVAARQSSTTDDLFFGAALFARSRAFMEQR
jgi:hypothetical protein